MLFGRENPPDKRDLVEGKLVQFGMRAAGLGTNVVFDFGFWGKDERSALRWIAAAVGAQPGRLSADRPRGATPTYHRPVRSYARSDVPHERR